MEPTIVVRFLKPYQGYHPGERASFDKRTIDSLLQHGVAELIAPVVEKALSAPVVDKMVKGAPRVKDADSNDPSDRDKASQFDKGQDRAGDSKLKR